jgi:DHA2 family multidrug resistance protein
MNPTAHHHEYPTGLRRTLTLMVLTTVTMLYAMTVTIANVALPQIQGALSATTDEIALVITFNIIATAVMTPMAGWLAGRFGRRAVIIWGVVGFTLASLLCGLAPSLEVLVLMRMLQGGFGAPLVPLAQAIALDIYPREQRGPVQAFFGMGVVLGPIIAPSLGGYLSETYSWRWVFFMVVPVGLMTLTGVIALVQQRRREGEGRLDWTGFLSLALAIAAAQYMLDRGHRLDWFESPLIMLLAGVAGLAFYFFIAHSATAERPFLSPRLLLDRNFSVGLLLTFAFGMLNFMPITLLPVMLQTLRDFPDSIVGLLIAARGSGTFLGFVVMFWASRLDPRLTVLVGFGLQGVSGYFMSQFSIDVSVWEVAWTSLLQGLGVGFIWVPLTMITFSTLPERYFNEGTAMYHLVRNFGSSVFISVSIVVVLRTTSIKYFELGENVSPLNEVLGYPAFAGLWTVLDNPQALASLSGEVLRQANMIGYINAFTAFAAVSLVALPLVLFVQGKK